MRPKLKEHLYRELVNELRDLVSIGFESAISHSLTDYGKAISHVSSVVSKYIEAGE